MLAFQFQATLLGIAAVLSALGGVISTVWAIRKGKREERDRAEEDCLERLKVARKEAEESADELHKIRMRKAKDD